MISRRQRTEYPSASRPSVRTLSLVAMMFPIVCLCTIQANAFQLSMVASRAPYLPGFGKSRGSSAGSQVTGSLISNLAVVALKMRLANQSGVKCDVTANSADLLLRGKVGPVTVTGRGWQSRLGLTCRAIEATVDNCSLDIGRVLTDQKLVLNTAARGNAMIALNNVDFGNFITHPLMKPPNIPSSSFNHGSIKFLKDNVKVDPKRGTVEFLGDYAGETWTCTLQRSGPQSSQNAMVVVEPVNVESENKDLSTDLSKTITDFFNEMVFALDGTYLMFQDLMVTSKGSAPSIMLSLKIVVEKFPSRGLAF